MKKYGVFAVLFIIQALLPVQIFGLVSQINPAIAFNGNCFLVVWQEVDGSSGTQIHARRVNLQGQYIDMQDIIISPYDDIAYNPAVINGSNEYFIVWADSATHHSQGARVSYTGSVVNNEILISLIPQYLDTYHNLYSIAFDGTNYLYTKGASYPITSYLMSQNGVKLDTIGIGCYDCSYDAKSIWGKSLYIVVWNNYG